MKNEGRNFFFLHIPRPSSLYSSSFFPLFFCPLWVGWWRFKVIILVSGACCRFIGNGRIGKRVKIPHGPATVKAF